MLHASAEAIAWMGTLVVVLAIAGQIAAMAWRRGQRRSACGLVGRDLREDPRSNRCAQILAPDIGTRSTLREPGREARLFSE